MKALLVQLAVEHNHKYFDDNFLSKPRWQQSLTIIIGSVAVNKNRLYFITCETLQTLFSCKPGFPESRKCLPLKLMMAQQIITLQYAVIVKIIRTLKIA